MPKGRKENTMTFIFTYLIISFFVGIIDIKRLQAQEDYLMSIPIGDLKFHEPKPITGIHNWVFLPSWIVIKGWISFVRFVNSKIDG